MADLLLDSDVVIWHLRGRPATAELVQDLSGRARLGLSAITRAEVLAGARPSEEAATLRFLDACETLPVDSAVADLAGRLVRTLRSKGTTLHLPDALIAAACLLHHVPLYTCNARHYPIADLDARAVVA